MSEGECSVIIISISSDIGAAMGRRWLSRGWKIYGTYRTLSPSIEEIQNLGAKIFSCDLSNVRSIQDACSKLRSVCPQWDILIVCPGTQEPVSPFIECLFDDWEESVKVNFTSQMRVLHELLPARHVSTPLGPCVLFFAGGGTNDAPVNYSSYIVSKIGLIKMGELLDAEIPDTRFVVVGPGWVKTKIHSATLKAGRRAGANYQRTLDKFERDDWIPLDEILDRCEWLIQAPRELISGRNFSIAFDPFGSEELEKELAQEPDLYKLRRFGNNRLIKTANK